MVLAARSSKADIDDLIYYHFDSKIHTCIKLHEDRNVCMVPLTPLVAPCYVIVNKNYCDSNVVDDIYTDATKSYIVYRMNK